MSKLLFIPFSVVAGVIAGALSKYADHGTRQAFQRLTGSWPGEQQPEQV